MSGNIIRKIRERFYESKPLTVGDVGEEAAVRFLEAKNYEIVEKNWRTRAGEIDIVCWQGRDLVFVEVKTRRDSPVARECLFENITPKKKRKLKLLVDLYINPRWRRAPPHRIDFIGVIITREEEPVVVEHVISGC